MLFVDFLDGDAAREAATVAIADAIVRARFPMALRKVAWLPAGASESWYMASTYYFANSTDMEIDQLRDKACAMLVNDSHGPPEEEARMFLGNDLEIGPDEETENA